MHMGCVYDGIPEALQSSETERSAASQDAAPAARAEAEQRRESRRALYTT